MAGHSEVTTPCWPALVGSSPPQELLQGGRNQRASLNASVLAWWKKGIAPLEAEHFPAGNRTVPLPSQGDTWRRWGWGGRDGTHKLFQQRFPLQVRKDSNFLWWQLSITGTASPGTGWSTQKWRVLTCNWTGWEITSSGLPLPRKIGPDDLSTSFLGWAVLWFCSLAGNLLEFSWHFQEIWECHSQKEFFMNSFNYNTFLNQNTLGEEEKLCSVTVQWTKPHSQILAVPEVGEWIEQKRPNSPLVRSFPWFFIPQTKQGNLREENTIISSWYTISSFSITVLNHLVPQAPFPLTQGM